MSDNPGIDSKSQTSLGRGGFLKLGLAAAGAYGGRRIVDYLIPEQTNKSNPENYLDRADLLIDRISSEANIPPPQSVIVDVPAASRSQEELIKYASLIATPALIEPTPAGETALLVLLTAAAGIAAINTLNNEVPNLVFIDPNQHMKERRGEEIAALITSAVEAAFMSPDPNQFKKKILCQTALGIIEGCDKAMFLAAEIATGGKTRVAAVLFGHESTSNQWKQITGLYYRRGKSGKTTLDHFVKWMERKGYNGYDICPADFPNPPDLFSTP